MLDNVIIASWTLENNFNRYISTLDTAKVSTTLAFNRKKHDLFTIKANSNTKIN